jgi:RNA recognition motif-containing protein
MYASNNSNGPPSMAAPTMSYPQYQQMPADAGVYAPPPATGAIPPSVSSHTNSKDPSMVKARVFVGNLNTFRVSREDLVGLFKSCGNVLGATLFKGYAFVQFSSATEAELCVQTLNGYTWEGSELDVKLAFSSPPKSKQVKSEGGNDSTSTTIPSAFNSSSANANNANTQTIIDCYYKNKEFAKDFPRQSFDSHVEGSFDDVLMCGECRFRTFDINDFADHKSQECSTVTKPPPEPESIQCFTCENTFESSWKLLQHLTDKHNLNLYRDASDDGMERRGPQTPSPLPNNEAEAPIKEETPMENEEEVLFS